jgi:quinol monooxygenase YgiN
MILVTANMTVIAQKRDEFLAIVRDLIKSSQAENGCISYRIYEDPDMPSSFVFIEEWDSQQILDQHFQEPHFKAFSQQLDNFVAGEPQVKVYNVTGSHT